MNRIRRFINLEAIAIFILFLGHTIGAYTSYGFHHPDEHFQILEWANALVGLGNTQHLPWEFAAQIRPWFQPMCHAVFVKLFLWMGIYNPFGAAFFFRLIYGYLNLFSLVALWKHFKKTESLNPAWFLWIGLLWFFPYIHVRTSSENLSGILLCFALLSQLKGRSLKSGLLFGFAFLARYQIALGLVGLAAGLLYRDRKITREHWKLFLGFLIPIAFGTLLDRIGYGNWVFTPYRYFKVNLVDGVAATFNPYPWYEYLVWILQLNPIVSLPLLAGAVAFVWPRRNQARSPEQTDNRLIIGGFVWAFFLLHWGITNKEYRFLFPILNVIPFMAASAFPAFASKLLKARYLVPYAIISVLGFSISTLHGASMNFLGTVTLVHRNSAPGDVWLSDRDYSSTNSYEQYYSYGMPAPLLFHDGDEFKRLLAAHPNAKVVLDGRIDDPVTIDMLRAIEKSHCKFITSNIPKWIYGYHRDFAFLSRLPFVGIFECHP